MLRYDEILKSADKPQLQRNCGERFLSAFCPVVRQNSERPQNEWVQARRPSGISTAISDMFVLFRHSLGWLIGVFRSPARTFCWKTSPCGNNCWLCTPSGLTLAGRIFPVQK